MNRLAPPTSHSTADSHLHIHTPPLTPVDFKLLLSFQTRQASAAHTHLHMWKCFESKKPHITQRWSDRRGNAGNFGSSLRSDYTVCQRSSCSHQEDCRKCAHVHSVHVDVHCALCPFSLSCAPQCACRRAFAATHIERVCNEQQRWIIHHCLSQKRKIAATIFPSF